MLCALTPTLIEGSQSAHAARRPATQKDKGLLSYRKCVWSLREKCSDAFAQQGGLCLCGRDRLADVQSHA